MPAAVADERLLGPEVEEEMVAMVLVGYSLFAVFCGSCGHEAAPKVQHNRLRL